MKIFFPPLYILIFLVERIYYTIVRHVCIFYLFDRMTTTVFCEVFLDF